MKVALTSKGNTLDSLADSRFGRCSWFLIYDTESKSQQFFNNPGKESAEGAGPAAVRFIASKDVEAVISGDFGVKVKPLLQELNIKMLPNKVEGKTLRELVDSFNNLKL